jgi:ABC-type multidrug transport system fused ATPase/permease subunit
MSQLPSFTKASGAASVIFAVIERPPRIPTEVRCDDGMLFLCTKCDHDQGGTMLQNVLGRISYQNVDFSYPTREQQVLRDISFVVEPGEKVAFVGGSGSGKSTLFQLLLRFYEPTGGQVCVDGVDVRTVDPRSLRGCMAIGMHVDCLFSQSGTHVPHSAHQSLKILSCLLPRSRITFATGDPTPPTPK